MTPGRVSDPGAVRVRSTKRREPPPAETLSAAALRHGMSCARMRRILVAAQVFTPGKGTVPPLAPDAVDRAVRASLRATAKPSTRASSRPAHVPDASGAVGCGRCWSIATITGGRIVVCRWCRGSATWGA